MSAAASDAVGGTIAIVGGSILAFLATLITGVFLGAYHAATVKANFAATRALLIGLLKPAAPARTAAAASASDPEASTELWMAASIPKADGEQDTAAAGGSDGKASANAPAVSEPPPPPSPHMSRPSTRPPISRPDRLKPHTPLDLQGAAGNADDLSERHSDPVARPSTQVPVSRPARLAMHEHRPIVV